jgi:hypothetical protein
MPLSARVFTWLTAILPVLAVAYNDFKSGSRDHTSLLWLAAFLFAAAIIVELLVGIVSAVYAHQFSKNRRWIGYWLSAEQGSSQLSIFKLGYRRTGLYVAGNVYSRTAEWVESWKSSAVVEDSDTDLIYIYTGTPRNALTSGWNRAVGTCLISFKEAMNSKVYRQAKGFFSESFGGAKNNPSAPAGADAGATEAELSAKTHTDIHRIDAQFLDRFGLTAKGWSSLYPKFEDTELIKAVVKKGLGPSRN